jgi:SAM-dependent methyltransferase
MNHKNTSTKPLQLSLSAVGVSPGKLRLLDDFIVPGKVLDVGCGNGLYGLHLASKGCELLQIDLADRRDERARHLPFRIMDAHCLEFSDNEFDHVIAFDIMEHLDDDTKFLQDIQRICKQRLFISVPNEDDEQIAILGMTHIHHKDKTHRREYKRVNLEKALVENRFNVLCIRPNSAAGLAFFAYALAKKNLLAKAAAKLIVIQCKMFMKVGLFENRTVGDWYCVAENMLIDKVIF